VRRILRKLLISELFRKFWKSSYAVHRKCDNNRQTSCYDTQQEAFAILLQNHSDKDAYYAAGSAIFWEYKFPGSIDF